MILLIMKGPFFRGLDKMQRIPQMYGNPKVHKKWTIHVPPRPVNSQVGSLSVMVSKYVDYYVKNCYHLLLCEKFR